MPKSLPFTLGQRQRSSDSLVQKFSFRTTDPDEFSERLARGSGAIKTQCTGEKFEATVEAAKLPQLSLISVRLSNFRVITLETRDFHGLNVPLDAAIGISDRAGPQDYVEGEAYLSHGEDPFDLSKVGSAALLIATIDEELLRSFGHCLQPEEGFDLKRLARRISFATPEGSSLWRQLALIWRQIGGDGALARSPLALREIELSLTALLVLAADRDSQNVLRGGSGGSSPHHLRRAEEFMAAHVTTPVSMVDLAGAAGASARTVLRAFQKHHGLSPMAFLKQRRLEAAQRSLLAAEPGSTTVGEVATHYGFFNFGRFAADYQRAFHEKPSETLRR